MGLDLDATEHETRTYIDRDLKRLGWTRDGDWLDEFEIPGMPNRSNVGYVDYVLLGDDHIPLAIIEAKRISKDPTDGRLQARLYANLLEKKYGRRPVIFLSNGYDTYIIDNHGYPERKVSGFYSKRDLEKLFNLSTERSECLRDCQVNNIAGRPYQISAVKSICEDFENKKRKALLVMATGSGKTRTVAALVDVLISKGWVKNVLFLADRNILVSQAKDVFVENLPNLTVSTPDADPHARCVFSTYQTMINLMEMFTPGHFDLVILDEAHRSVYNKYKIIIEYFDSLLVGLTATPKTDIDRNTYEVFGCYEKDPTFAYELDEAVRDGWLVDYRSYETEMKFMTKGITYLELPEDEREEYENTFGDDEGIPESIESSKMNEQVFNRDTIVKVLDIVMRNCLKIDNGNRLGKTIIFAVNHEHAEKIHRIIGEEYPQLDSNSYAVIDNYQRYASDTIRKFSKDRDCELRIAISVDMMDTGVDVPDVLNLVFFKKVFSRSKFWQMIGRGTRRCFDLIDGKDKDCFLIFDFCDNFRFFRVQDKGRESNAGATVAERMFNLKARLVYELQSTQAPSIRSELVADLLRRVREIPRDNFAVRMHLQCVDKFSQDDAFLALNVEDLKDIASEVSPLMLPYKEDIDTVRFDSLMYSIELARLKGCVNNLPSKVAECACDLSKKMSIPEVSAKVDSIRIAMDPERIANADVEELERLRTDLRGIMKYLDKARIYDINFIDTVISSEINESNIHGNDLKNYRQRVESYIREHKDSVSIKKLMTNEPLDARDVEELEDILWSKVGSREEYEAEYHDKPLGVFVREIVGLDRESVMRMFSEYLNNNTLNTAQKYFVQQIVEHVVRNGTVNVNVLKESPFTDKGPVSSVFGDDMTLWNGIMNIIKNINSNALII